MDFKSGVFLDKCLGVALVCGGGCLVRNAGGVHSGVTGDLSVSCYFLPHCVSLVAVG
jgi:hypothetical protein